jgi:cytidylate kinase
MQTVSSRGVDSEARPAQPLKNIAISRETGTHDRAIAAIVSKSLGWHVFDHELTERIAHRLHVPVWLVERHYERIAQRGDDAMAAMASAPELRESQYVRNLVESTLELAADGNCVFIGRGAAWILPAEQTLRVALMAPREHRIAVVMEEQNLSFEDAARNVDERDERRARFAKAHCCSIVADAHAFDLVLNTARLSIEHCAALIVAAVEQRR